MNRTFVMLTVLLGTALSAFGASDGGRMVVDDKAILDVCFVVSSLDLAVLGFLYSSYASIRLSESPDEDWTLPIVSVLTGFCRALVAILVILLLIAGWICFQNDARPLVWILVACFAVMCGFSFALVFRMRGVNES